MPSQEIGVGMLTAQGHLEIQGHGEAAETGVCYGEQIPQWISVLHGCSGGKQRPQGMQEVNPAIELWSH